MSAPLKEVTRAILFLLALRTEGELSNLFCMGTIKECMVLFEDERGVRHAVQVEAESLNEALGRALPRLRELGWTEDIENAHRFRVESRSHGYA